MNRISGLRLKNATPKQQCEWSKTNMDFAVVMNRIMRHPDASEDPHPHYKELEKLFAKSYTLYVAAGGKTTET